jgi:predicted kinase
MVIVDCDGIDVALLAWPEERALAEELARERRPRVLLVGPAAPPPVVDDRLEDWVRVPADHGDVEVRARRLARMTASRHLHPSWQSPVTDGVTR